MADETLDILGRPTLPKENRYPLGRFSSFSILLAIPVISILLLIGSYIRGRFLIWRERSYRLAMRRRHGIPDDDHRPFNVAYAAVVRARQEEDAAARKERLGRILVQEQCRPQSDAGLWQRKGILTNADKNLVSIPGRFDFSVETTSPLYPSKSTFEERYKPSISMASSEIDADIPKSGPSGWKNRVTLPSTGEAKKFNPPLNGSDPPVRVKKVNSYAINGRGVVDRQPGTPRIKRGSKRVFLNDDDFDEPHKIREKRPRKFSLQNNAQDENAPMDIDEEIDEMSGLNSSNRGKKRDREAARSVFDEDDDSLLESDNDDPEVHRRRKRRTFVRRKSEAVSLYRGQKRDREADEDERSLESDEDLRIVLRKRGKRSTPESIRNSVATNNSRVPLGKVIQRPIGEEWESNGVRYKISADGQRLRQTLIKKERQKFLMPKDSQHPDCQANLEVCVEAWLTEDKYREAKEQMRLAWQDSSKLSIKSESPSVDSHVSLDPQFHTGKDLLWQAPNSTTAPATPTRSTPPDSPPFRQGKEIPQSPDVGVRINTAQTAQNTGKRIASIARVSSVWNGASVHPGSPASPLPRERIEGARNGLHLSKWEKQDLEAKAMMRMREAMRKKEDEKSQNSKEVLQMAEKEKEAKVTIIVPSITVTKPVEEKISFEETKVAPPTFAFAAPATTSESVKTSTPNLFFSNPPKPATSTVNEETKVKPPTFFTPSHTVPPSVTGTTSTANKSEQKPSLFALPPNNPSMSSATPSTSSIDRNVNPTAPTFSFASSSSQRTPSEEKKIQSAQQPVSLFIKDSQLTAPVPSTTTATAFAFDKISAETSKSEPLGTTSQRSSLAPPVATKSSVATSSNGPKFSFGQPAASPVIFANTSSTNSATSNEVTGKSTAPSITFSTPESSDNSDSSGIAGSTVLTAPKFRFSASENVSKPLTSTTAFSDNAVKPLSFFPTTFPAGSASTGAPTSSAPKPTFTFPSAPPPSGTPAMPAGISSVPVTDSARNQTPKPLFGGFGNLATSEQPKTVFSNLGDTGTMAGVGSGPPSSEPAKPAFVNIDSASLAAGKHPGSASNEPLKSVFGNISGTNSWPITASDPLIIEPPKSVFGKDSSNSTAFGANSVFGTSSTPETAGNQLTKPAFTFGTTSALGGAGGAQKLTSDAPLGKVGLSNFGAVTVKSVNSGGFSFATAPPGATTPSVNTSQSSFGKGLTGFTASNFGGQSNSSSIFQPPQVASSSVFGIPSTSDSNPFSFASSNTTSQNPFAFKTSAESGSQKH